VQAGGAGSAASYHWRMEIVLRPATVDDIEHVLSFWLQAAEPTSTDSADALGALLDRDPSALIVGETDGKIVGSVIAGWDGWRGAVYRLAVGPAHRRRGLGQSLLRAAEERLTRLGGRRLHAIVVESNADAVAFWDATDWEHQEGQFRFAKG
jgi:ribosomal protein S18 acetylase RimI-like enzyme